MNYKIGSMNMYKFQVYRSDDEIRKDLDAIANIIREQEFDIVGMQEIYSEAAMRAVLNRLGGRWDGNWDTPNSHSPQAAEGYAFIWNKSRIRLIETETDMGKRTHYPRIYNQYRVDRRAGEIELLRNPYFARFKPINGFFEIRVINTHIRYSKGDTESDFGAVFLRQREFDILTKRIYTKISDKRYGDNMPAYTVLLGDYNLNIRCKGMASSSLNDVIELNENGQQRRIITIQEQRTTIKMGTQDNPADGYANNYDHFTYDANRFEGIDVNASAIDTVNEYCDGNFEKHRKEISDHIPVQMSLNFRR